MSIRFDRRVWAWLALCIFALYPGPRLRAGDDSTAMAVDTDIAGRATLSISIDARELPRNLLHARLSIPLPNADAEQVALWYPKWVPGSHAPGGPLANVAGITIHDQAGNLLSWTREPGEVFRLNVQTPPGTSQLEVELRYVADQPTTNSMGHDVFSCSHLGIISPGCVLLYPDGADIDEATIDAKLELPEGWLASTALQTAAPESDAAPGPIQYASTTLRTFVDSPIMCGKYRRVYDLTPAESPVAVVPHRLHLFGDSPKDAELSADLLAIFTEMVRQTAILTGSQPFDRFEILLGSTRFLPANGLEHSRSTLNVLSPDSLRSAASLKGWNRLLIPHEYLHSWCGKYRRPAGMATSDFHTPKGTELLWVYEGLTQYLGELVEARCGLMNKNEFRHRVAVELRNAQHQHNRQWRPLSDTASASQILRDGSRSWPRLRGGQDYYMEGMLFWLEVDGLLRQLTHNEKTLDDFCHQFFAAETQATAVRSRPKPFDRQEIVDMLDGLAEYDWDGMIRRQVESPQQTFNPTLAGVLGYRFEAQADRPDIPGSTFRMRGGLDELDTIGAIIGEDGTVNDLNLGSPADLAKLAPGMKILGVNGFLFNSRRFRDAIQDSATSRSAIELLVVEDEQLHTIHLQYHDGPRYLSLVKDENSPDVLESILQPR